MKKFTAAVIVGAALFGAAQADESAFTTGPVFDDYGPNAAVDVTLDLPEDFSVKHSFDVSKRDENGGLNRTLVSAARFINMHARAGVPVENMSVAVVVHGGAVKDVSTPDAGDNAALIAALTEAGVRVIVCGQSAAYYDVATKDLLPGVDMALSAMTAHAMLQQDGYTLNPF